jgi:Cu+-exporting ATPase
MDVVKSKKRNWKSILQIGVAGFCFSNIMMMSFPDYFAGGDLGVEGLGHLFSGLIVLLSLPVIFYSAAPIFISAYRALRQREINIDAPIALASIITFSRSYYEIFSGSGSGYLDSGTGIIFFMLIGRWFQQKTYDALSFDRKYKSYFPLGVTIINDENKEESISMNRLKIGDKVITRNEELIPADAILVSEAASLDYSFVTGENAAHSIEKGETIYAGGKQMGASIISEVIKLPSQSYITELWNNSVFNKNKENQSSFVHPWSRYFTLALFSFAIAGGLYWSVFDASKVWMVVTSVLIVACPCSLLLSATFTYGNMLRILGKYKLFLKNANVIESLSEVTDIVFDKTGTITKQSFSEVTFHGNPLQNQEQFLVKQIVSHSGHVLSKGIFRHIQTNTEDAEKAVGFMEEKGKGISAMMSGHLIRVGNGSFVSPQAHKNSFEGSEVHVSIDESYKGYFKISHQYREGIGEMLQQLQKSYRIHLLSGDGDAERKSMTSLFGSDSNIQFSVSPQDKLNYIQNLQEQGKKVMMVGDGLNDAGALMQANVGLAVSENQAHFTPASDGIIDGDSVAHLSGLLSYARSGKKMVAVGFAVSLMYNVVGVGFALQGLLSPVFAAILMPVSSITIVSLAIALSSFWKFKTFSRIEKQIVQHSISAS